MHHGNPGTRGDEYYMAMALRLAERGRYSTQPNPRVGCVIVRDGEIVGQGFHQRAGEAHAEINALAQAGNLADGADVYVSLEPCSHHGRTPPCAEALIRAKVARVVVAMMDPNPLVSGKGMALLEQAGVNIRTGVCERDAQQLNLGFIKRMRTGRPLVRLKIATSLDGKIAMSSGESAWITSVAARADVHRLRLDSCAVLTGINTVSIDDPQFTVRLAAEDIGSAYTRTDRSPVRVVLDSRQRLGKEAKILQQPGETWQLIADHGEPLAHAGATRLIPLPASKDGLDLHAVLDYLGEQQINNVLVEAGAKLAAAFIKAGLVDELIVYQSPDIMGSSAYSMFNLPEILKMSEKIRFEYRDLRRIGRDLKLVLLPSDQA